MKNQKQDEHAKLIRPDEQQTSMRKDKKTVESICLVTRHLMVPKYSMVFDYNSTGDLFYMVLHGKIDCKVPIPKQIIYLSKDEYNVFVEEFRDDLMQIKEDT